MLQFSAGVTGRPYYLVALKRQPYHPVESVRPLSTPDFPVVRTLLLCCNAVLTPEAGRASGEVLCEGARAVGLLKVSLLFHPHGHCGGPPAQQRGFGPPGDAQVDPWTQLPGSGGLPPEGGLMEPVFYLWF